MNLKSTLWALAFACAAVSCSDDVDDGLNNNEGNELNGPTTYMKVNISSNITTKANPAGGEGEGTEVGSENEYDVDDLTVILYKNEREGDFVLKSSSTLVGAGYALVGGTSSSSETEHSRQATVTVEMNDAGSLDGKTYGVIAVTNLGNATVLKDKIGKNVTTGVELADFLQATAWSGTGANANKFIMSSHKPDAEKVTLKAGSTPETAPSVTVHVERLAAKVRINKQDGIDNFLYTIGSGDGDAKVILNNVALVNQWKGGSYLLKRVSPYVAENPGNGLIPSTASTETEDYASDNNFGDDYLGDELWGDGYYNYVIDPETRNKITDNISSFNEKYLQPFSSTNYSELWKTLTDNIELAKEDDSRTYPLLLGYTQENTTAAKYSLKGYSTGALFKATYIPAKISKIDEDGNGVNPIPYEGYATNTPIDFYVFQGNIYDSYDAIWAQYCMTQLGTDYAESDLKYDSFNDDNIQNISMDDFMKSPLAKGTDPFGYVAYLKKVAGEPGENGSWDGVFSDDDSFDVFCAKYPRGAVVGDDGELMAGTAINFYDDGICYYPYWIRHANNDDENVMGVMEFGIVRNNIYELQVQSVSGLGLSGIDVPDPEEPVETDDFLFNVVLYVRDWVVRSNGGIIL